MALQKKINRQQQQINLPPTYTKDSKSKQNQQFNIQRLFLFFILFLTNLINKLSNAFLFYFTRKTSAITGFLTKLNLPIFLRQIFIYRPVIYYTYAIIYAVDIQQIQTPINSFKTFNQFFTRSIKIRSINPHPNFIVSPCDSKILKIEKVLQNNCSLIKHKNYKLGELMTGNPKDQVNEEVLNRLLTKGGSLYQIIFYLNPGDYHRFHCPTDFSIKSRVHFSGNLLPVKETYLQSYQVYFFNQRVYQQNERVGVYGTSSYGFLSQIYVGAFNVGSIDLKFDSLKTNWDKCSAKSFVKEGKFVPNIKNIIQQNDKNSNIFFKKGDQLGKFNMGSTIVMLIQLPSNHTFLKQQNQTIKFGQSFIQVH